MIHTFRLSGVKGDIKKPNYLYGHDSRDAVAFTPVNDIFSIIIALLE